MSKQANAQSGLSAIGQWLNGSLKYIAGGLVFAFGELSENWEKVKEIPWEELANKASKKLWVLIVFSVIWLILACSGLFFGWDGHWIIAAILLGISIIELLIFMFILQTGKIGLTVSYFGLQLAKESIVDTVFWSVFNGSDKILQGLVKPLNATANSLKKMITTAMAMNLSDHGKSAEEIENILQIADKIHDQPTQKRNQREEQNFLKQWKEAEESIKKIVSQTNVAVNKLLNWVWTVSLWLAIMFFVFLRFKPGIIIVPKGYMPLDTVGQIFSHWLNEPVVGVIVTILMFILARGVIKGIVVTRQEAGGES